MAGLIVAAAGFDDIVVAAAAVGTICSSRQFVADSARLAAGRH